MRAPRVSALLLMIGCTALGVAQADNLNQPAGQVTTAPVQAAPAPRACAGASRVKARLAARHLASHVSVRENIDTDGIIWLSGTVPTLDAAAQATRAAMETEGVTAVHNAITVQ